MVGCYLAPHDTSTLENIVAAIGYRTRGAEILINGDFNNDLDTGTQSVRDKAIAEAIRLGITG